MYWTIAKESLFLLLAFLDAEFTKRKLAILGVEAELNPTVRKFVSWFGLMPGVDIAIIVPTFGWMVLGWYFPEMLVFALGIRFCLFLFQWRVAYGK